MLNRHGSVASYDEVERIDSSSAKDQIEHAEESGVIIPSNIHPGGELVQAAADNLDFNEETLDGKQTTHATSLVLYQRQPLEVMLYGQYGPRPKPQEKQRKKSTKRIAPVYNILHYAAGGRKPKPQTSGQIQNEWFTSPSPALIDESYKLDMAWVLTRLAPQKLFAVDLLPSQHDVYVKQSMQKVPGWSGYNSLLSEKSTMVTAKVTVPWFQSHQQSGVQCTLL